MEHKKKIKKIGFIFGLKREMNLVSHKKNNIICVCGYGKGSKNATQELINFGVDIVINFGFAGSASKNLKNGDIVFINKFFNEKKEKLSTLKFDKDLLRRLESSFKFFRGNLLTVNKIIADKKEKLNLVKKFKSISVIDMEAFYIKKELLKAKIPMMSIKVIFDDLSFDIPLFIQDCINDNGELKRVTLFGKLVLNPLTIFDLLKLNFKFIKSKKVLKDLINNL
jgi:purine-nucleoside phosphorylase